MWRGIQPTERRLLLKELQEARDAQGKIPGWSAVVAVVLVVSSQYYLAAASLALGVVFEVVRQWKLSKTIRRLWRELRDPIDGS
jgi:hypothetical protein